MLVKLSFLSSKLHCEIFVSFDILRWDTKERIIRWVAKNKNGEWASYNSLSSLSRSRVGRCPGDVTNNIWSRMFGELAKLPFF